MLSPKQDVMEKLDTEQFLSDNGVKPYNSNQVSPQGSWGFI